MALEQNSGYYQIIVLLVSIILMIAVCSSSPVHERQHRDGSKDNCDGPGDHQQAFCFGFRDDVEQRQADVQRCFDKLYRTYKLNQDINHISINEGRCRCTVKAISKWKWDETFKKARESIYRQCCGFTYNVMGRYENDMRVLAMCS